MDGRDLLEAAFERAPIPGVRVDRERAAPNPAACRLLGRARDALQTRAEWLAAAHPDDPNATAFYARARGEPVTATVVGAGGRPVPVRVSVEVEEDAEVWWLEDLRAEAERTEVWRVFFEEAPEPHALIGNSGYQRVNRALAMRLGFAATVELLLHHPGEFAPPTQPNGRPTPEVLAEHERAVRGQGRDRTLFRHEDVDRQAVDVELTSALMTLAQGPLVHTHWRDLTDVLRQRDALALAADELRTARLVAERASEARGRFLANVSHELRTPLNGVLGMTSLLLAEPTLPTARREPLGIVKGSAEALLQILNDVLDLSKIEAGTVEVVRAPLSLWELCQAVVALSGSAAGSRGLTVRLDYPREVARRFVGDAQRIRQVLENLVSNALKFTFEGAIVVRVRAAAADGVVIEVQDSGIGIAQENLERIFEAFEQEDASTTRRFGGTGLGLSISRRLASLMGGTLEVESELGRGSTFALRLPLAPLSEPAGAGSQDLPPASWSPLARPLHALLAEDNAVNELVAKRLLARLGISTDVARDGREAVERGLSHRYDVIFMDIQMPELDGLAATRHLRSAGLACPIIAMTANAMHEDQAACLEAGMDAHLPKPVTIERVHATLLRFGFS